MHHVDRETPWEEIWQAMELLVQQGKVLYVGSSNFAALHLAQAQYTARERSFMGLVCEQSLYNLKDRMIELEVIPTCETFGLGLIPWSPLASGLLAGVMEERKAGRRTSQRVQDNKDKFSTQIIAYEDLCRELGESPADVAIAWLLSNAAVTAPIIGPRTIDQLDASMRSLDIDLSPQITARLDEIWPGPGGAAPEAYAW